MTAHKGDVEAILRRHGMDPASETFQKLASELSEFASEVSFEAYQAGEAEGESGKDSAIEAAIDEARLDADAMIDDLATFVRLAKSDPDSAAVYFHRATGRHLFEVHQPCLL